MVQSGEVLATEERFQGIPISDGVAIGTIVFIDEPIEEQVEETEEYFDPALSDTEVGREILRYRKAIKSSRIDLQSLQYSLAEQGTSREAIHIIDSHIQMLEDPLVTKIVENRILDRRENTEVAFKGVMEEYQREFLQIENEYFKQRWADIKDLTSRVLKNLNRKSADFEQLFPENSILCTKELVPTLTAEAPTSRVMGLVSNVGGETSHAALIARAKGLPFVTNIEIDVFRRYAKCMAIIDGYAGVLIVNPKESTLRRYREQQEQIDDQYVKVKSEVGLPTVTEDGCPVEVLANIESLEDIKYVNEFQAAGIGLLRSEFLQRQREVDTFSEIEQLIVYQEVANLAGDMPVAFRLFDVGGDKKFLREELIEENPAMGLRSIRYLLNRPAVMERQIRALLKANKKGNIKILLPLITDVQELCEAKQVILDTQERLSKEGYDICEKIEIGCMVEVPSAVFLLDLIAQESDFLAIGTNDLIQFTLAADRGHSDLSDFHRPSHPSVVRMIDKIVKEVKASQKPLSICGEIASNPMFTSLLLGLGIRRFSVAPRFIPIVKQAIRKISVAKSEALAKQALTLGTSGDVHALLTENYCSLNG